MTSHTAATGNTYRYGADGLGRYQERSSGQNTYRSADPLPVGYFQHSGYRASLPLCSSRARHSTSGRAFSSALRSCIRCPLIRGDRWERRSRAPDQSLYSYSTLILNVGILTANGRFSKWRTTALAVLLQDHDSRPEEIVEEAHERGDEQRRPLRPGYGHALGCKLAEDDVQESYSAEGRGEGDDVDGALGYT